MARIRGVHFCTSRGHEGLPIFDFPGEQGSRHIGYTPVMQVKRDSQPLANRSETMGYRAQVAAIKTKLMPHFVPRTALCPPPQQNPGR